MKKNAGTPLGVPARAVDTLTVAAPVARGERWKTRGIAPSETTPSAAVLAALPPGCKAQVQIENDP